MIGASLGPYRILEKLGEGGMGEVYLATDTALKRQVAIKVLPASVAGDAERLARFQREAEVLAALNHPNIATIYGLERLPGESTSIALVMELVEGPTLADRIERLRANGSGLSLDEVLPIAKQITEALEAAHEQGIVHRDLKPANIKVRDDGTVKVLDFGLAKALGTDPSGAAAGSASMSPTITTPATRAGVILGTAAYMAPEQARGKRVDKRADIWAFGCVLFEMLTGTRAFRGDDVTDTIVAVVSREPDWQALPPEAASLRSLLERCLKKDPKTRMRDIGEARLQLDDVLSGTASNATASQSAIGRQRAPVALVALALIVGALVAAGGTWILTRRAPSRPPPVRFSIVATPAQPIAINGTGRDVTLSADGTRLFYVAGTASESHLMMRTINQLEAVPVPGTEQARGAFLSPDEQWIGFFTPTEIKKVPIAGGAATSLCRTSGLPMGATWNSDDTIIFATNSQIRGLSSVPGVGGEPKVLTRPDVSKGEVIHTFPSFLPGGQAVLFTVIRGALDSAQIAALDLKTGERKTLIESGSHAEYVEPGYLVFAAAGSLRAVRFDPERLEVSSEPVPVVEGVTSMGTGVGEFSMSRQGSLVYVPGSAGTAESRRSLVWVDRQGQEEPIKAAFRNYFYPRLSPDGTKVALDIRDQQSDIWIWDLIRGTLTRLTDSPSVDSYPVWTPDSKRIIFSSTREGATNLFWQPADNTGTVERLTTSQNRQFSTGISPDGLHVTFKQISQESIGDVHVLQLPPAGKGAATNVRPLLQTRFNEDNGEISPDGRWIAYQSDESGQLQIHVRSFPDTNGGHWMISTDGGVRPRWAPRSGRELFYLDPAGALMAVPVQTTPVFSAGSPARIVKGPYSVNPNGSGRTYDVSPDGKRFLMIKNDSGDQNAPPATIVVVLNWLQELQANVPAK